MAYGLCLWHHWPIPEEEAILNRVLWLNSVRLSDVWFLIKAVSELRRGLEGIEA